MNVNASNFVISAIRTYVPIGVGLLCTWLASSLHIVISPSSQAGLVALCAGFLIAAYWTLVRVIERAWPAAGVFLGYKAQPHYVAPVSYYGNAANLPAPPVQ